MNSTFLDQLQILKNQFSYSSRFQTIVSDQYSNKHYTNNTHNTQDDESIGSRHLDQQQEQQSQQRRRRHLGSVTGGVDKGGDTSSSSSSSSSSSFKYRNNKSSQKVYEYFQSSPATLRKLLEIYSIDYMTLGLPIPSWVDDILATEVEEAHDDE